MTVVKLVRKRESKQGFEKKKSGRYPSGLIYWLTKWLGWCITEQVGYLSTKSLFSFLYKYNILEKMKWKYQDVGDHDHLEDDDDHVDDDLEG